MDAEFYKVLYRLARADADLVIGPLAEDADAFRVAEHKMHLKRVKRRMIAAIQTTRVKWAVRCIDSACPREQQAGRAVTIGGSVLIPRWDFTKFMDLCLSLFAELISAFF